MKKCPYCGAEMFDEAEFCLFCMKELVPKKDLGPFKKKNVMRIAAVLTAVAVVAAAITSAIFLTVMKKEKAPEPPNDGESGLSAEETTGPADAVLPPDTEYAGDTETESETDDGVTDAGTNGEPASTTVTADQPDTNVTTHDETTADPVTVTIPDTATVPETTKTPAPETTPVPETTKPEETKPETETPGLTTDVETTETVSGYVSEPYHILTIREMHDFMKYKREKYCPPPVDTLWCTTPLYDMNGWRGYGYEYRKLIKELDENENVISRYEWVPDDIIQVFINENNVKSVFINEKIIDTNLYRTDYYQNDGLNTIAGAVCYIIDAVGLIEYIGQCPPEINQFYDARVYAHEHGLWVSERKIPGFQRHDRSDGWRGILQELGINSQNDLQNEGKRENVQCYYWEIVLPEGERDIRLTVEYREFTTGNGEETHLEAVMLVEYAD